MPLFFIGAGIVGFVAAAWLAAPASAEWREPILSPPQQTFAAPLTTGDLDQSKPGRLLLDPFYNPSDDTSLNFTANRPLEVRGRGGQFNTPYTYSDEVRVDTDTLYVSSATQWVGIGTDTKEEGEDAYALVVRDGTTQVGTAANPYAGVPVRSYTSDAAALSGYGGSTGTAGVYGLTTQNTGWAVRGESAVHVGVQGESSSGIGIYASSQSASNVAVYAENSNEGWAGYFQGRLGAGSDIIAERFLQTYVGSSLEKFAQPRVVYNGQISTAGTSFLPRMMFDGTYIWITNASADQGGNNLFKVRAGDGSMMDRYHVAGIDATPHDIVFDGEFIWMTSTGQGDNSLLKFDPDVGQVVARCSTIDPTRPNGASWGESPNDLIITSEDGGIYIWTANTAGGDLTKFDQQCNQVGVYPIGEGGSDTYLNRLNAAGYMMQPYDIEYSNGSVWTLTPNVCSTAAPDTASMCFDTSTCSSGSCIENGSNLVEIDPATGEVLNRYASGVPDAWKMVSDGYYMWVISRPSVVAEQRISKIRISDGLAMPGYPLVLSESPRDISFDGSHVWIVSSNELLRINAATDQQTAVVTNRLQTNTGDNASVFDGNHLWVVAGCDTSDPASCGDGSSKPLWISKVSINQNTGQPDFGSVVQLRRNPGLCSLTTTQQCLYDWHCPASETCVSGYSKQTGHINIAESLTISHGHCYAGGTHYFSRPCTSSAACSDINGAVCTGGNLRVDGDIESASNQWSGDEVVVDASGGAADCPDDGTFMTGAVVDSNHEIVQIMCRGI